MSHSPEPWAEGRKHTDDDIIDRDGCRIMGGDADDYSRISGENVERVIACVNACRKISTAELQKIVFREEDDEKWHVGADRDKEYVPIEITGWPCGVAPEAFDALKPLILDDGGDA